MLQQCQGNKHLFALPACGLPSCRCFTVGAPACWLAALSLAGELAGSWIRVIWSLSGLKAAITCSIKNESMILRPHHILRLFEWDLQLRLADCRSTAQKGPLCLWFVATASFPASSSAVSERPVPLKDPRGNRHPLISFWLLLAYEKPTHSVLLCCPSLSVHGCAHRGFPGVERESRPPSTSPLHICHRGGMEHHFTSWWINLSSWLN